MSARRKPSWWWLAAGLAVVALSFADLVVLKGPLHLLWQRERAGGAAAEVAGSVISRQELAEALREHLWRQNQAWAELDAEQRQQWRRTVLDRLINGRLVRASRLRDAAFQPATPSVRREIDMQQRQFAAAAEYPSRLAAQGHTSQSWQEAVRDAQFDEQWLQARIDLRVPRMAETELRSWFDREKEKLRIPPAWHAAHLFLSQHGQRRDRSTEIREIHRKLMAKQQTFAALAAAFSEDERTKALGGDLGWFTRERMPADFIAAVEKLPVGQFSEPFSTRLGWHIVIVLDRRESRLPQLDEVREEIAALWHDQRRNTALQDLIAGLHAAAAASTKYHAAIIDHVEPAP